MSKCLSIFQPVRLFYESMSHFLSYFYPPRNSYRIKYDQFSRWIIFWQIIRIFVEFSGSCSRSLYTHIWLLCLLFFYLKIWSIILHWAIVKIIYQTLFKKKKACLTIRQLPLVLALKVPFFCKCFFYLKFEILVPTVALALLKTINTYSNCLFFNIKIR